MAEEVKRAAVIGAGTMGSDLSLLFALYDVDVTVTDKSKAVLDALPQKQKKSMDELRQMGITRKTYDEVRNKITIAESLKEIKDVDFVLEAVAEDLQVKRKVFAELDKLPKNVVLATNTSSLTVTDIAKGLKGAERIGGMHFSNPPILSQLAEVVKGEKTSEETIKVISKVAEKIGRVPVMVKKDVPGFVNNRILVGAGLETLWAIHRREVTPQELDASLRAIGFPMGFAEAVDIIGVDIILALGKHFVKAYGKRFQPPPGLLESMAKEGRLGKKSGKGFYDWSKGPPVIDMSLAGKYDVNRAIAGAANEAFWIIKEEVADPETIDKIVKLGFRSPVGICELADAMGLDNLLNTIKKLHQEYGLEIYKPCPLFEEYVKKGWTGKAAGRGFYKY
ncbi:MAG: 3-hydroxyacyl-CoA dehydrogenase [Candidatus Freyarchaeota archaeon]|nr:3-hydroxyacyl-CoA dehydrogenase [Candidatus Jordarchaeia archaeon]MBS7267673.1 3-hydroxyacyl-CoA dehydrogenase [Candidatus Jordarchaeia archaeon]MBS7278859.1 3-hydroxyacyl-CoA dehydrogenase [Candidatus Jordarchaeia archaeon]